MSAAISALLMGTAQLSASSAVPQQNLCQSALSVAKGDQCVVTPNGVVLAASQERSDELAVLAYAGEQRFKTYFGQDPARYAIIEQRGSPSDAKRERDALKAIGFRKILVWLPQGAFAAARREAAKRGAEANARAAGATEEQIKAAVAARLKESERQLTPQALALNEATIVPHEIGHLWYSEAYWPGFNVDSGSHYGSPSPDWLDETAAVLMEGGIVPELRRQQFQEVYRGRGPGELAGYSVKSLVDLPHFLSREHPAKALQLASGAAVSSVRVIDEGDPALKRLGQDPVVFYLQSRMFADFLMDQTGEPSVFGSIGAAFGRGESFHQWLASEGTTKGLPHNVAALNRTWLHWLKARFGPPARS